MTTIEWTDRTWNPVTGCTKISPGCKHCYMHRLYPRLRGSGTAGYEQSPDVVQMVPKRLEDHMSWRTPQRIFVCSMADLFHADVTHQFITMVFRIMEYWTKVRGHTFQVLTKRPQNAIQWWKFHGEERLGRWPTGVWMGTSVELAEYRCRLDELACLPAPVRFLSAEPLLGPLDVEPWLEDGVLQWVIVGGESGPGCRPMRPEWARDLRDQCQRQGVPFFLKQLGGYPRKRGGDEALLDGVPHREFPTPPSPVCADCGCVGLECGGSESGMEGGTCTHIDEEGELLC